MLMTSLACTDCSMGVFVTSLSAYPAIHGCWPFGDSICMWQAFMLSALFHESTLSLTLIAVDRYMAVSHPLRYQTFVSKRMVIGLIITSWILCFLVYGIIVIGFGQCLYYYDMVAMNCEPEYSNSEMTTSVLVIFYLFPTVLIVVRVRETTASTGHLRATRTLAIVTMGFFVAVTPWTLTQLLMTLTQSPVPELVDFTVTWVAISNSFWNTIIYLVSSTSYRKAACQVLGRARRACGISTCSRRTQRRDYIRRQLQQSQLALCGTAAITDPPQRPDKEEEITELTV
ncbi:hypothetical protein C0Q70_10062 [Pomacea canaliculata]|uniref:G-protein coupled receptors family 1 profile domain-containing protein n=1 Tax=Pomacea canaliculata TaxID=400727 RepID=A0A2T7PBJ4_POMCA|nr:hypothetical protein C0Q70_10062 [Pomacea canaliculata]